MGEPLVGLGAHPEEAALDLTAAGQVGVTREGGGVARGQEGLGLRA